MVSAADGRSRAWLRAAVVTASLLLGGTASRAAERCVPCHAALVHGLGRAHDPRRIGCVSCHLGDPQAAEKGAAHAGMVPWPGSDLANAAMPCARCHAEAYTRVASSLMTTNGGLVAVNRFVFAEADTPDGGATARIDALDPARAADRHAAELCSTCHLGAPKDARGLAEPASRRGGGCLACHLRERVGEGHPAVDLRIGDDACFGCHSRSGRISLSYAGWTELDAGHAALSPEPGRSRRILPDGRVLESIPADVHRTAGLGCVDCHTVDDVMGDFRSHAHQEDAVRSRCVDCHLESPDGRVPDSRVRPFAALDRASQVIARSLWGAAASRRRYVAGAQGGVLLGAWVRADGRLDVRGKRGARPRPPAPTPRAEPHGGAHARLSCDACHTALAPRCLGCHTRATREASNAEEWEERGWSFSADAPTLGVDGNGRVTTFVPGMILTLEHDGQRTERRLFAPLAAHQTGRKARDCASCHRSAVALGIGDGTLELGAAEPRFVPRHEPAADGLPRDAWTRFLADPPAPPFSTRTGARPFDAAEQRRILRVGACLGCHESPSPIYRDFAAALGRRAAACRGGGAT
ncbi:MAG: hypothetical protein U0610_08335 [bacterium]